MPRDRTVWQEATARIAGAVAHRRSTPGKVYSRADREETLCARCILRVWRFPAALLWSWVQGMTTQCDMCSKRVNPSAGSLTRIMNKQKIVLTHSEKRAERGRQLSRKVEYEIIRTPPRVDE